MNVKERNMKYGMFALTAMAAAIIMVLANIRTTYSPPVANGCAGVSLFIFLWFIFFIIPRKPQSEGYT